MTHKDNDSYGKITGFRILVLLTFLAAVLLSFYFGGQFNVVNRESTNTPSVSPKDKMTERNERIKLLTQNPNLTVDDLYDFQAIVPYPERAKIYEAARNYVRKGSVEGTEFDLIFKWKKSNWIYFEVIFQPTETTVTDTGMLYLENTNGKWVGRYLGTAPVELWQQHPEWHD